MSELVWKFQYCAIPKLYRPGNDHETIRICIAENVLAPFLASRQKEVLEIMVMLFDQEKIAEIHDYNVAKTAREEGREEGHQLGLEEGIRAVVSTLRSMAVEQKQVAQKLVEQFHLLPHAAEEKVKQYWMQ